MTVITDPDDAERWDDLPDLIKTAKDAVETRKKDATPDFEKWLAASKPTISKCRPRKCWLHAPLDEGSGDEIKATVCDARSKFKASGALEWKADGKLGAAPVIKKDATFDLGDVGDFEKDQSFSYGAWVKSPGTPVRAIIARMDEGNDFRGWDLWEQDNNFAAHIINKWPENALKVATEESVEAQRMAARFRDLRWLGKPEGVKIYVNGAPRKTKVEQNSLNDTIRTTVPLRIGQRSKGSVFEDGQVQDVRVYRRKLEADEVKSLADNTVLQSLVARARTSARRAKAKPFRLLFDERRQTVSGSERANRHAGKGKDRAAKQVSDYAHSARENGFDADCQHLVSRRIRQGRRQSRSQCFHGLQSDAQRRAEKPFGFGAVDG